MTRVLICDDEGIVQQSIKFMIEKSFGGECETAEAKNGRAAIELSWTFRPDIILMDIQMPGINGIEAMQEIRKENKNVIFIVLTAYDKFEYTTRSIDVGVMAYLTKPVDRDTLTEALRKAMRTVKERKEKVSQNLRIKEKLEAVLPIIENGFIYSALFFVSGQDGGERYRELLNVAEGFGYVMVVECGDELFEGALSNMVGAGVKLQKHYPIFREIIKETTGGVVGNLMANKAIIIIPCQTGEEDYNDRVIKIDRARGLLRKLERLLGMKFKSGIGSVKAWAELPKSYREAMEAVRQGVGRVIHIRDIPKEGGLEEGYAGEIAKDLFGAVKKGEERAIKESGLRFLIWLENAFPAISNTAKLKALEFVLYGEYLAYDKGGRGYQPAGREDYLGALFSFKNYEELGEWFLERLCAVGRYILKKREEKTKSVVEKAKTFIEKNFSGEISLEEMAKEIGISPYYLSKLFKEAEGVNYIDYVTGIRIGRAKRLLRESDRSIKDICREAGYGDPNYFSRIFKKWEGETPTEFREGGKPL